MNWFRIFLVLVNLVLGILEVMSGIGGGRMGVVEERAQNRERSVKKGKRKKKELRY